MWNRLEIVVVELELMLFWRDTTRLSSVGVYHMYDGGPVGFAEPIYNNQHRNQLRYILWEDYYQTRRE